MRKIDVYFLLLATVMLLTGVAIGIRMATTQDFQLTPVHAHANLVGWASLALFGLTYRAYPELKTSKLAIVHFALAATAAVLMPYAIYRAVFLHSEGLAMISSTLWLLAVLAFLIQVGRLAFTRDNGA